jgi:hypothetical protein
MARIRQRRDRHFIDDHGQLFWINGPDHHCYLSEQRQWREGLSFEEVLEWKQCSPSGLVSQRFTSLQAACEAFEHNQVIWSSDLYLRRMGDEMALQRGCDDYKPTAMKEEEARGARPRRQPWLTNASGSSGSGASVTAALRCELSARPSCAPSEAPHLHRRRRSSAAQGSGVSPAAR